MLSATDDDKQSPEKANDKTSYNRYRHALDVPPRHHYTTAAHQITSHSRTPQDYTRTAVRQLIWWDKIGATGKINPLKSILKKRPDNDDYIETDHLLPNTNTTKKKIIQFANSLINQRKKTPKPNDVRT